MYVDRHTHPAGHLRCEAREKTTICLEKRKVQQLPPPPPKKDLLIYKCIILPAIHTYIHTHMTTPIQKRARVFSHTKQQHQDTHSNTCRENNDTHTYEKYGPVSTNNGTRCTGRRAALACAEDLVSTLDTTYI